MPFLRDPQSSSSHRSWRTLVSYGDGKLFAQCRTAEGLKKNGTWSHKLAYKEIDLEPYRMIINTGPKERFVIGISKTEDAMMKLWEELMQTLLQDEQVARDPESYLTKSKWKDLYGRIPSVTAPLKGLPESYQAFLNNKLAGGNSTQGAASVGSADGNSASNRSTLPVGSPVESMSPTSTSAFTTSRASAPASMMMASRNATQAGGGASPRPSASAGEAAAAKPLQAAPRPKSKKPAAPGRGPIYGGVMAEKAKDDAGSKPVISVSYLEEWALNAHRTWTWGGNAEGTSLHSINSVVLFLVLLWATWNPGLEEPVEVFSSCSWLMLACCVVFSGIHLPALFSFVFGGIAADDLLAESCERQLSPEDAERLEAVQEFVLLLGLYRNGVFQTLCCTVLILDFITTSFVGELLSLGGEPSSTLGSVLTMLSPLKDLPTFIGGMMLFFLFYTWLVRVGELISNATRNAKEEANGTPTETAAAATTAPATSSRDLPPSPASARPDSSAVNNTSFSSATPAGAADPVISDFLEFATSSGWELDVSASSEGEGDEPALKYFTKNVPWCDKKAVKLQILCPNSTPETLEHILCQDVDAASFHAQSPNSKKRQFSQSFAAEYDKILKFRDIKFWVDDGRYYIEHSGFKSYFPTSDERDVVNVVKPRYYLTEEEQEEHGLKVSADELRKATADPFEPCVFVQAKVTPKRIEGKRKTSRSNVQKYPTVKTSPDYERATLHLSGYIAQRVAAGTNVTICFSYDPCGLFPAALVDLANADNIQNAKAIRSLMMRIGPKEPEDESLDKLAATYGSARELQRGDAKDSVSRGLVANDDNSVLGLPHHEDCAIVSHCLKNFSSKEWRLKQDKDGVLWQERSVNYCDKKAMLFSTTIPNVTPQSFEATLNDDKSPNADSPNASAYKYDAMLKGRRMMKRLSGEPGYSEGIYLTSYKAPVWGIAPRDMLTTVRTGSYLSLNQQRKYGLFVSEAERTEKNSGKVVPPVVFVQCAMEPNEAQKAEFGVNKGYQRGAVHFNAWVAQATAAGIKLHFCLLADPCGSLPASLVAAFSGEQLKKIDAMKKLVLKTGYVAMPEPATTTTTNAGSMDDPRSEAPTAGGGGNGASDGAVGGKRVVPAIDSKADPCFKAFESYYTSTKWVEKSHKDSSTIQWYDMDSPNPSRCDKKALLFKTKVPNVSAWAFNAALNDDPSPERNNRESSAFKTDTLLQDKVVIKWISAFGGGSKDTYGELIVVSTRYKAPVWGIAPREMQTMVHEIVELDVEQKTKLGLHPDRLALLQTGMSCADEHCAPVAKSHQKGEIHAFGYLCQEDGQGGIDVHLCLHVDPAGRLPASVVATTNGAQLIKIQRLKDLITPHRQKEAPAGWVPVDQGAGAKKEEVKQQKKAAAEEIPVAPKAHSIPGPVKSYLELILSGGWDDPPKTNKKTPGITLTTKTVPWAKTKAAKLLFEIPGPVSIDVAASVLQNVEFSKKMDPLIGEKKIVRTLGDNVKVSYTTYKSPMWGIAARDMCTYWTPSYFMDDVEERKKYGAPNQDRPDLRVWFTVGEDCNGKEMKEQKGFTRSTVHYFGFMAAETADGGLDCYNCYSSTPGGSMPASLVDATNMAQFDKMEMIRNEIKKGVMMENDN